MGRFFCAYKVQGEEAPVIKTGMFVTKTDNVFKGTIELLVRLSQDNNIPAQFVEKETSDLGILYINPHKYYAPKEISGDNLDDYFDIDLE